MRGPKIVPLAMSDLHTTPTGLPSSVTKMPRLHSTREIHTKLQTNKQVRRHTFFPFTRSNFEFQSAWEGINCKWGTGRIMDSLMIRITNNCHPEIDGRQLTRNQ